MLSRHGFAARQLRETACAAACLRPGDGVGPRCLPEYLLIRVVVEPDDERLTLAQRRSPQVAGRAEHQFAERFGVWFILLQIQVNDFLTFGDVNVVDRLRQLQRLRSLQRDLLGIHYFFGLMAGCRKKLLRFSTAGSAGAMVLRKKRDTIGLFSPNRLMKKRWRLGCRPLPRVVRSPKRCLQERINVI
jgi:hypothetical protein